MISLYVTKERILTKNSTKYMAWKLVPGPFLFLKNLLYKEIRGNLHADFDNLDRFVITYSILPAVFGKFPFPVEIVHSSSEA